MSGSTPSPVAPSTLPASDSQAPPFTLVLRRRCAASAETVYATLVDIHTHLEWAGRRQSRLFRLTQLEAPSGPLVTGSRFASRGRIFLLYPTQDVSVVTAARPGRTLEFVTENRYLRRCEGRYLNRYDLEPDGDGCRVTYTFTRLRMVNAPVHMRGPMRVAIQRFGAPILFGRGLDNLIASAQAMQA